MPGYQNGVPHVIPADPMHALPATSLELARWIDENATRKSDPRLTNARTPTAHTHDDRYYTETEVDQKLGGKVNTTDTRLTNARTPTAHNHDDRYYTETEVDQKLGGKVNTTDSRLTDARTPTPHTHPEYVVKQRVLRNIASLFPASVAVLSATLLRTADTVTLAWGARPVEAIPAQTELFALPAGFRPTSPILSMWDAASVDRRAGRVFINSTNGLVTSYATTMQSSWCYYSVTYLTADLWPTTLPGTPA